jgi:pantothenate kinase
LADQSQQVLSLSPQDALNFLVVEARRLDKHQSGRVALGIAGGPGSGKSTLAARLVDQLNAVEPGSAGYVPMDGFHMLHAKLEALGTVKDKGAPHTFEGEAFATFLAALKSATGPMSGPGYSRKIEDVVQDAFIIAAETRILIVEGNYLLLPDPPWSGVKPLLDLAVFIAVERPTIRARLLKRHAEEGLFTDERNREHVDRVDLPNYDLVALSRPRADIAIDLITDA